MPIYNHLVYFSSNFHVEFAVVALLIQVVLVVPFLTLLLLSPYLIRCSWFNIIMARLKPILDEFQACYKDEYRSFAGFYLMSRQIIFFLGLTGDYFFTIYLLQVFAIIMLLVHAVFQPYRERWLNVLDTLFITDLLLLSILHGSTANLVFASSVLLVIKDILIFILVLFPLGYFILLCLWPVLQRMYTHLSKRKRIRMHPVKHIPDEREPILFEQSIHSTRNCSNSITYQANVTRQPTQSVVGISHGSSHHSNANEWS